MNHIKNFQLSELELTTQHFLVLAIETTEKIGWDVQHINKQQIIAYTKNDGLFFEITIKIENDVAHLNSASMKEDGLVDWGYNKKNVYDFVAIFDEMKSTFTKEELDEKFKNLEEQIALNEKNIFNVVPPKQTNVVKDFLSIFIPTKDFFVTPILININIAIFILMIMSGVHIISPTGESLINWGANFKLYTLDGQWWRLMMSCFLHIGILHLLMNMYALLYIGILLEPLLGKSRFISAYLLTGLSGSVASLWWNDMVISAGASGAIFGMYGVFFALLTTNLIEKDARQAFMSSIMLFIGYNLVAGLGKDGVDNAAHIGGLLSGLFIGYMFFTSLKENENKKMKYIIIATISVFILVVSFVVYLIVPNNIKYYNNKFEEFSLLEKSALEAIKNIENTPKEETLENLQKGIFNWIKSKKIIEDLQKLNFSSNLQKRNEKLKKYCELRINSYELLRKAISEDSDKYNKKLSFCNTQIETILSELSKE